VGVRAVKDGFRSGDRAPRREIDALAERFLKRFVRLSAASLSSDLIRSVDVTATDCRNFVARGGRWVEWR
jgi:hypothetical protein